MTDASERETARAPAVGRLSIRKKILFSTIAFLAFVVLAEIGIRLVCWVTGRVPYTVATPWCRADDDLLYVFKPNFTGRIFPIEAQINRNGMRGPDVPVEKPAGVKRVLCLGDSRTFGYWVGEKENYPARLDALLQERYGAGRVQVLNAGTHGYSAYQGLRYLETRGLKFQPDVVTAAFDFNDRRFVLSKEHEDGPEHFRRSARGLRWRNRMAFSYLLLGVNKLTARFADTNTWAEQVMQLPSQRLDDLHCRVEPEAFEASLEKIATVCRERGIRFVIVAMSDTPVVEQALSEAQRLRSEGKLDEALRALAPLRKAPGGKDTDYIQWSRPLALYEEGLIEEAKGNRDAANAAFRKSAQAAAFWSIMGGLPVRRTTPYLEAMKRVSERHSIPLVDIAGTVGRRPECFADLCHYTVEGHRAIAEELAAGIIKNGLLEDEAGNVLKSHTTQ